MPGRSRYVPIRITRLVMVLGVSLAAGLTSRNGAALWAGAPTGSVKVGFSESLRQEKLTTRDDPGFSSTVETRSAAGGNVTINAEIDGIDMTRLNADTPIFIKLGGFEFHSSLGSDRDYRAGKTSARLEQKSVSRSGNSQTVVATAWLKWDGGKLRLKVEAQTPGDFKSAAAGDFLESTPGDVKAETTARIQLGDYTTEVTVPFQGRVRRKVAVSGDNEGQVVTVDLHGDGKARAEVNG